MSTQPLKVSVKATWGKEVIECDWVLASGAGGLKALLSERTGVPNDRMKLMSKSKGLWKGVLKDNTNLASLNFKAYVSKPIQILLMGSATSIPTKPKKEIVFIEDLPPEEAAKHSVEPAGLINLGNTCYLNSVVQCLKPVKLLRAALTKVQRSGNNGMVLSALKDTFDSLDSSMNAISPVNFVMAVRMRFPQFAQQAAGKGGMGGGWMQQDAEEFYSALLSSAADDMSGTEKIAEMLQSTKGIGDARNVVDVLFGMEMEDKLICDENDQDYSLNLDTCRKLVCNIQGASSETNVNHIYEGIELGLSGKIQKHSELLGRDAFYTRKQRMTRLPPFLVVQFGRFYWKATPDSQDHAGVKCKIMKPVAFDSTLDVYQFCSEGIQEILKKSRDKEEEEKESKMEIDETTQSTIDNAADDEEAEALRAALQMSTSEAVSSESIGPLLPDNFQGYYELFGVVTHKGRDADGGHYMGWVKEDEDSGSGKWFVFDDDEVSPCATEDVLKLKGGGDWHMSYLNFYRAKK